MLKSIVLSLVLLFATAGIAATPAAVKPAKVAPVAVYDLHDHLQSPFIKTSAKPSKDGKAPVCNTSFVNANDGPECPIGQCQYCLFLGDGGPLYCYCSKVGCRQP